MGINRRMEGDILVLENTETGACVRVYESIVDGQARIAPEGKLTLDLVHDLEDELTSMVLMCSGVTIDLTSVQYIANSVIRMILDIQHMVDSRGGTMRICIADEDVWSRFEEMGLGDVFEIERV